MKEWKAATPAEQLSDIPETPLEFAIRKPSASSAWSDFFKLASLE